MIRTFTLAGTALLALAAAAHAQARAPQNSAPDTNSPAGTAVAAADDGGEIIVTAQKRSERLQDVPVAVSVVSGATLERLQGINIENAQYLVPALNFRKSGTALNQSIYLRGIGTTTFSIGGEPSVSTVLDGVVLSRSGERSATSSTSSASRCCAVRRARCSARTPVPASPTSSPSARATISAALPRVATGGARAANTGSAAASMCRSAIRSSRGSPASIRTTTAICSTTHRTSITGSTATSATASAASSSPSPVRR